MFWVCLLSALEPVFSALALLLISELRGLLVGRAVSLPLEVALILPPSSASILSLAQQLHRS